MEVPKYLLRRAHGAPKIELIIILINLPIILCTPSSKRSSTDNDLPLSCDSVYSFQRYNILLLNAQRYRFFFIFLRILFVCLFLSHFDTFIIDSRYLLLKCPVLLEHYS